MDETPRTCSFCNVNPAHGRSLYCSRSCAGKAYYQAHKDQWGEYHRRARSDPEYRAASREAAARWRANHPDRARDTRLSYRRGEGWQRELAALRQKRRDDPEWARTRDRASHLRRFRLTVAEYDAMLADQGGVCAVCRQAETRTRNGVVSRLAVDHDHATGEVRGLLCHGCNTAIGSMGDSPELLVAAASYLRRA